jgi:hypothetical protein
VFPKQKGDRRLDHRAVLASGVVSGVVAILTVFAIFWCFRERGRDLVDTYGAFRHGLGFLGNRVGLTFGLGLLALSLASFLIILTAGIRRTLQIRSPETILLAGLLLASLFVTSYGLSRVYERHILPVFAFTVLFSSSSCPPHPRSASVVLP